MNGLRGKRTRSLVVTEMREDTYVSVLERSWPRWPAEPSVSRTLHRERFPADITPEQLLPEIQRIAREHLL